MIFLVEFLFLSYVFLSYGSLNIPCDLQKSKYGFVCKCTADYCDYLEEPKLETDNKWIAFSSSKGGLRFSLTKGEFDSINYAIDNNNKYTKDKAHFGSFNADAVVLDSRKFLFGLYDGNKSYLNLPHLMGETSITIDRSKAFQKIVGFGGALTGTVAYLLENLTQSLKNQLYKSYYHKNGIAYNLLRSSIGGCDFDLEPWAYNLTPENDKYLTNFTTLDQRDLQKIMIIKQIESIAKVDKIKIMAAAWSPPPWMKTNNDWTGFSSLKPEYYETWANYHLRYLELMSAKNITIWAISTGNEPLNGVIGWLFVHFMSLGWTPINQAIYLNDFLGPALKKSKFKNVLIFSNDDQRYSYPQWFRMMNSSRPTALKYIDGLAVHWYWDDFFGPELIDDTIKLMPDKLLLNTEACIGDKPWESHGPLLGSWERGERYARSILQDLQHNFNGWMDWNLVLDESGGPNYVKNTVDAPVIINTASNTEFYKQPMFYVLGHFSKFIKENSKRIEVKLSSKRNNIDAIGFQRPDNNIVLIIYNGGVIPLVIKINDSIRRVFTIKVPAHSIHTIIYM